MKALLFALALSAVNPTFSPDSSKVAYTLQNDLYVQDVSSGDITRLTYDGTDDILNGYASWVYYEEIFGRSSLYRAFWWSPDSKMLAFYRFDQSKVENFPIYSPFGQYGSIRNTRYPKAGTANPEVKVGIAYVGTGDVQWANFADEQEYYYGTPFWGDDSRFLYIQREPRRQNELNLFKVDAITLTPECIYTDNHPTWVDWIDGMLFTSQGFYFVRDSRSGWQQICFLSYEGRFYTISRGKNWDINLLRYDEVSGHVWFTAKRDSRVHPTLYRMDTLGGILTLTDPRYWTKDVHFSSDGKEFTALQSSASVPWIKVKGKSDVDYIKGTEIVGKLNSDTAFGRPLPELVQIENEGFELYGLITFPENFSIFQKYPVVMQLYGGPGTPYVRDRWKDRDASDEWCYHNGVIYIVVDPRSSGENGRAGLDEAYGRMTVVELRDYIAWAKWLQSKDYVDSERIGVEGFSFGGTTTAMLVLRYPEYFRCGIAGGGVYDWTLYDTHYTERFMNLPSINEVGYEEASVTSYVNKYGVSAYYLPGALRLTHGSGDDNVHFQNTLQLCNALEECGAVFELSVYPDGMHGYRGAQKRHSDSSDHHFWKKYLLDNK